MAGVVAVEGDSFENEELLESLSSLSVLEEKVMLLSRLGLGWSRSEWRRRSDLGRGRCW